MNKFIKSCLQACLVLLVALHMNYLNSAIGCQSFAHTVDYSNVSVPINQDCACSCRQASYNKGYCPACKHYGDPDRGRKTAVVLSQMNILLP